MLRIPVFLILKERNCAPSRAAKTTNSLQRNIRLWRGGRVAEGAPLLREYGSKAHRGFESLPLRQIQKTPQTRGFLYLAKRLV